jgi:hypothetical protein
MRPLSSERRRAQSSKRRRARYVSPGPLFDDIVTITDDDLRSMSYGQLLAWCSDGSDRLLRSRLLRAARACGHSKFWTNCNTGRRWQDVLAQAHRWRLEHG